MGPGKYPFNTYAGQIIRVPTTNFVLHWITGKSEVHRYDESLRSIDLITKDAYEPLRPLIGLFRGAVGCLSLSPAGGARLAVGTGTIVELWDATAGKRQALLKGHRREVRADELMCHGRVTVRHFAITLFAETTYLECHHFPSKDNPASWAPRNQGFKVPNSNCAIFACRGTQLSI